MFQFRTLFIIHVFLFNILQGLLGFDETQLLIQPLTPYGVRVSIPDEEDIDFFTFSGRVNNRRNAAIQGSAILATKGKWQFQMDNVELSVGDVISFTAQIQTSDSRSRKLIGTYRVEKLYSRNSPWLEPTTKPPPVDIVTIDPRLLDFTPTTSSPTTIEPTRVTKPVTKPSPITCEPSPTVVNGEKSVCAGQVIFEDNFSTLNRGTWTAENRLPRDDQENPFVLYSDDNSVVYVEEDKLHIKPRLLQSTAPYSEEIILTGSISLNPRCTAVGDLCTFQASGSDILPPVMSGRITTKKSFNFKYGTIEIRAKLPHGDWLYPELFLIPRGEHYGSVGYASGILRVAFVRGNTEMRYADSLRTEQIDNKVVYGGLVLDQFQCHDTWMKSHISNERLTKGFHTYSLTWKPDMITLGVDGTTYGTITAPSNGFKSDCPSLNSADSVAWGKGTQFAPFDQEFYIALGVGAGGVTDFPNGTLTTLGKPKPWLNRSSKAKFKFWQQLSDWNKTWRGEASLLVDSVTVRAI